MGRNCRLRFVQLGGSRHPLDRTHTKRHRPLLRETERDAGLRRTGPSFKRPQLTADRLHPDAMRRDSSEPQHGSQKRKQITV